MKLFIVVINAISGGGKTTITKELEKRIPNAKALYFDDRNYDSDSGIQDTCKWIEDGADVNVFKLDLLVEDIEKLIKCNFDFIIMDYPFGYRHRQISKYINYSVFIDTPFDMAMARRILRDYNEDTATLIFDDMRHYLERGRSAYLYGLEDVRKSANFVVDGSQKVDKIIECILEKVTMVKSTYVHQ